jgi:hypothetical protein
LLRYDAEAIENFTTKKKQNYFNSKRRVDLPQKQVSLVQTGLLIQERK